MAIPAHLGPTALLALALACGPARRGAPESAPTPDPAGPLSAASPIARAAIDADVARLRTTFAALHPGLGRYNTAPELERAYAELDAELGPRPTLASAYLALTRFTARLRCGHTYLNPTNQSEAVQAALLDGPRLPFGFRWLDGHMAITRAFVDDPRLAPGTEVTAIGAVATADLLAQMLPLARADGHNDAARTAELEVRAEPGYQAFDVDLGLLHPELTSPYPLTVRRPDGTTARFTVAATTAAQRRAALAPAAAAEGPRWRLEQLDADTAYLRMASWVVYDTTWDWEADLDRTAAALVEGKTRALIVDLRGNGGGNDVGDRLIRHLIAAPLTKAADQRRVRYRAVPAELRGPLDTWDPSFFDWGAEAVDEQGGFFRLAAADDDGSVLAPLAPRYGGKVIVLVDAANSSATFQFAELVQRHHLATLIGEPTGGNQRGINGGAFFFVRLPDTGLEVDLPLIGRFPTGVALAAVPDAGITPDVVVRTTAADLAAGRDPQLAAARALATR